MAGGLTGVLRIGAIPSAQAVLPLLTAPFRARHPGVRISCESLTSRAIVERLAEFDLDLGMTYVDGEPLGVVRTVPLYREQYVLLVPAGSELADRDVVGWDELAGLPLCLLAQSMQNRRILDRNLAAVGVTVQPVVEADTLSVLYSHAVTGGFSTVLAAAWLRVFGVPDGVRAVPLAEPAHTHAIGVVLADRQPGSMLARAFLEVAAEVDLPAELERALAAHLAR
jgi:DNA-binding transcriptional LysR family regulator